jgi:hypothetical protein
MSLSCINTAHAQSAGVMLFLLLVKSRFKETVSRDFRPLFFCHQTIPSLPPDSCSKIFSNFVANSPRYKQICVAFFVQNFCRSCAICGKALDHDPALGCKVLASNDQTLKPCYMTYRNNLSKIIRSLVIFLTQQLKSKT